MNFGIKKKNHIPLTGEAGLCLCGKAHFLLAWRSGLNSQHWINKQNKNFCLLKPLMTFYCVRGKLQWERKSQKNRRRCVQIEDRVFISETLQNDQYLLLSFFWKTLLSMYFSSVLRSDTSSHTPLLQKSINSQKFKHIWSFSDTECLVLLKKTRGMFILSMWWVKALLYHTVH